MTRERAWRFLLGLVLGLALGAAAPALASISGGGGGGGSPTSLASDEIDATFTTTSLTYVAVTGTTVTATANANEVWMVVLHTTTYHNTNGEFAASRIDLDSGTGLLDTMQSRETAAVREGNTDIAFTAALSAASHTVSLQGRVNAGTATWDKDAVDGNSCSIQVVAWR